MGGTSGWVRINGAPAFLQKGAGIFCFGGCRLGSSLAAFPFIRSVRSKILAAASRVKILGLSDRVVPFIHSHQIAKTMAGVDLVLGCGDLPAAYLEFVLTALNVPLAYVPGNHDPDDLRVPGGTNADGRLVRMRGVRILGLGGSMRYKPEGRHQYTEAEMSTKVMRKLIPLMPSILIGRPAFDILLTHAPPKDIHDGQDPAHRGFRSFRRLLSWAKPALMLHGHMHAVRNLETTETLYAGTRVLNVFPYRVIDWDPAGAPNV